MNDNWELLNKANSALNLLDYKEAESYADMKDTRDVADADLHMKWADVCEELGRLDDAVRELNMAVRDDPANVTALRRLAEIHHDNGDFEKAVKQWREILKLRPDVATYYVAMGEILIEMREYANAAETYRVGFEKTGDPLLEKYLKSTEYPSQDPDEIEEDSKAEESRIPTDPQLVTFMDLFSGREGVYARQWASHTGESGYTPIREPFTIHVARNHITGKITTGVYPVRVDNTVCFIAFDIDIAKHFLAKAVTNQTLWERADAGAQDLACKLVDLGAAHQIPVYMEDSGFKGRHCWIFLDTPVQARIAKRFGLIMLKQLGRPSSELQVEVFPKQGYVTEGKLGNLIKLPLGIHRRSGRRSLFVDASGDPLPEQLTYLSGVEKASKRQIYEFIQRFRQLEAPVPGPADDGEVPWKEDTDRPASSMMPAVHEEYQLERDQEFQYLVARCHVLRAIIDKMNSEGEITNDERIVLTYSVGLLEHGPEAVNELLGRCANVDASSFLKSRLRGNPISCPKIRARVPEITSRLDCKCKFDPKTTLYPSPMRHLQEREEAASGSYIGKTVESLQFQQMLQQYLNTRKQLNEMKVLIDVYEARLNEFFSQAGIESVDTPMGTLKRILKEDDRSVYTLEI